MSRQSSNGFRALILPAKRGGEFVTERVRQKLIKRTEGVGRERRPRSGGSEMDSRDGRVKGRSEVLVSFEDALREPF